MRNLEMLTDGLTDGWTDGRRDTDISTHFIQSFRENDLKNEDSIGVFESESMCTSESNSRFDSTLRRKNRSTEKPICQTYATDRGIGIEESTSTFFILISEAFSTRNIEKYYGLRIQLSGLFDYPICNSMKSAFPL